MTEREMDEILRRTFDDRQLTRTERQALKALITEEAPDEAALALYRSRAFALARERMTDPRGREVLDWLEETLKTLLPPPAPRMPEVATHFSPGDECLEAIISLLTETRYSADICVFTITDDRITRALLDAHRREVAVRVISDDEKARDPGSDIRRLRETGIPVLLDSAEQHMHHKFAVFDRTRALTGSYNWTRTAAAYNHENVLICDDPRVVLAFCRVFDELWSSLGGQGRRAAGG